MNKVSINWRRVLDVISGVLLVFGSLNWGLIGLFHVDLVAAVCGGLEFGETNTISRVIYSAVGAAGGYAVYYVVSLKQVEKHWSIRHFDDVTTTK